MKEQDTNYFTYESYLKTKGKPYCLRGDKIMYFNIAYITDAVLGLESYFGDRISIPHNTLRHKDCQSEPFLFEWAGESCPILIEIPERTKGTHIVPFPQTYQSKVQRVKKDAIDRIKECIEVQLDYVAKELGIEVDSICLNIESTQDVIRFDDGHTETQIIPTITMDIKL